MLAGVGPVLSSVQRAQDITACHEVTRLLVIDDDPMDRRTYLRHLDADEKIAYVVVEAATAEEGADLLADGPYDCIILDYRLPGVDGLAAFQEFRDSERAECMPPVIMMTSQGSEIIAVEAMKLGIADYMTKDGLTASGFRRAIKNAVERGRLRSHLSDRNHRLAQLNGELKSRAAELQRVYNTVSHELKTPLTAVREFIALVLDEVVAPLESTESRRFLELALDGCDQIARHVNDLVDATKLEVHKLALNPELVPVERVVTFALASISEAAQAKDIRLVSQIAQSLPLVRADRVRFAQVLGNLLGNAVKFTGSGGAITVLARQCSNNPGFVEIVVADTGCGIAPEHLPHVFERLYQVPHTGDELMGGGLGLGLSIARDLVRLQGGQIGVKSSPGAGSSFSFTLPTDAVVAEIGA